MNWRLALVAFAVLPLIALVTQWFRRNVRESYRVVRGWIARINAFLQENITGMSTVQLFRREALNFARFDDIDRKHRDANIESIFYYAVFYPAIEVVSALASALIIWYGGASVIGRHADARRAGGVPPVLAALLPADQRHVGEVQRAAVGDGLVGAHLQAARRAGAIESPRRRSRSLVARLVRHRAAGADIIEFDTCLVRLQSTPERTRTGLGAQGRVVRGAARRARWASSARPDRARRRSSICCCGSTTCSAAGSRSTASTSASSTLRMIRGLFSLVLQDVHLFSGHDRRQHPAGQTARSRTTGCAMRRAPSTPTVHRAAARRLRRAGRRARRDAVGRSEAAAVVRARAGVRPAGADPRRGDVERRHRDRAADPRRARGR